MKKLVSTLLAVAALAVTLAPGAQARPNIIKPIEPLYPPPCICLPAPDVA
jgi:hypothetical protein